MAYFAFVAWAALGDVRQFRIPNAVSLGLILLYPAHVLASPLPVDWLWASIVSGGVLCAGMLLFAWGIVGGGDVKFLCAAALWAGPHLIAPLLAAMSLSGGLLALAVLLLQHRRRYISAGSASFFLPVEPDAPPGRVPYGVAIALGAAYVGARLLSG